MKSKPLVVFLLFVFSGSSFAFDCGKAFLQTDFVICSSPDTLQAENELEKVWHLFLSDKDEAERKAILEGQRNWITQYAERCGVHGKGRPSEAVIEASRPCVKQALKDRAEYLEVQIERGRVPTSTPSAVPASPPPPQIAPAPTPQQSPKPTPPIQPPPPPPQQEKPSFWQELLREFKIKNNIR